LANLSKAGPDDAIHFDGPPSYGLFGYPPDGGAFDTFHVERISSRFASHGGQVEPHRHPHLHQLIFWLSGQGTYLSCAEEHRIEPGMLCWAPANWVHGFSVDSAGDAIVVSMTKACGVELAWPEGPEPGRAILDAGAVIPADSETSNDLAALFALATDDYDKSSWGYLQVLEGLTRIVLVHVARHARKEFQGHRLPGPSSLFQEFQALLESRFREHPRMTELTASLGTTSYLLNRACFAATGLSATSLVRKRIIKEAERLLLFTDLDVGQIAYQAGFEDRAHFSRAFRHHHGITPRAWRNRWCSTGN
jgi:AraC family transcriptional regulator, transcriptional activator of pobA